MNQEKEIKPESKKFHVNVTGKLKSFEGKVLQDTNEQGKVCDSKVRIAIVNGLLAHLPNDTGSVKLQKYMLAKKVYSNDVVELSDQDISLIMYSVMAGFSPMVIGGIYELFETAKR